MLQIDPSDVCAIIAAAARFHGCAEVVIPDEPDAVDDDWAQEVLAGYTALPEYLALRRLLDALAMHEQVNVLALMWLGRGDYTGDEWAAALEAALAAPREHLTDYLMANPGLAGYLETGLGHLGYDCDES